MNPDLFVCVSVVGVVCFCVLGSGSVLNLDFVFVFFFSWVVMVVAGEYTHRGGF